MDPFSPDGDGSALELIAPRTAPDHHVAANWCAVELIGELISNEPKLEIHVRSQDCRGHREALVLPREGENGVRFVGPIAGRKGARLRFIRPARGGIRA